MSMYILFCLGFCDHLALHVLTPSFPTRRYADLPWGCPLLVGLHTRLPHHFRTHSIVHLIYFHQYPAVFVFTIDDFPAIPLTFLPGNRSEEHTSELQSLMRI